MSAPPYPTAPPGAAAAAASAVPYPTSGPGYASSAPAQPSAPYDAADAGPEQFKSPIQMFISCKNLIDKDILSKSDPICVVDLLQGSIDVSEDLFREIGRTEWIKDNLNPTFSRSVTTDYFFEAVQHVRFMVYDVDDEKQDVRRGGGELLGTVTTKLSQIVTKSPLELNLTCDGKKSGCGTIKITAEEMNSVDDAMDMTWTATRLDKMDFFGKSDPFLEFSRSNPDGSFSVAHRTEVIKSTLNPSWKPTSVGSRQLCNSDYQRSIRINCQDWNKSGTADFIGSCDVTVDQLRQARLPLDLELVNEAKAKKKKKSYRNSGVLHLQALEIHRNPTFLDYISSGLELNFVVGIDFTGSNGDRRHPKSLHYNCPTGNMNEYQRALWAVGSVCEQYDTDKLFPAYGFGAKVPPLNNFSNIFNLSIGSANPECHGVSGILAAYQQAVTQVQLWGPTNAAPIVSEVADLAEEEHKRIVKKRLPCGTYQILLLLTDGILTDMDQTVLAVIRASRLPMSIIIVGVGSADFSDMEALDADDALLEAGGNKAMRDIVQFVPFSKFASEPPERLAKEVLAEVPTQVLEYMQEYRLPLANQR
eukprot:scpid64233/ scgid29563/ Copine-3; Copine III